MFQRCGSVENPNNYGNIKIETWKQWWRYAIVAQQEVAGKMQSQLQITDGMQIQPGAIIVTQNQRPQAVDKNKFSPSALNQMRGLVALTIEIAV